MEHPQPLKTSSILVSVWKGRSFLQVKAAISMQLCPRTQLPVTILRLALVLPHSSSVLSSCSPRSTSLDQQSPHAMVGIFLFKNFSELELPKNLQEWPVLSVKGKIFHFHKMGSRIFYLTPRSLQQLFPICSIFFSIWHMWPNPWCKYCGIAYLHEYTLSHSLLKITGSTLDAKNSWKVGSKREIRWNCE